MSIRVREMSKTNDKKMHCYCGSQHSFEYCCLPFLNLSGTPKTPEQLMRSRFSAYVTKHIQYIYDTYASETQKQQSILDIKDWASKCTWLALDIHQSSDVIEHQAFVEFSVYFIVNNKLHEMREKSRFVIENVNKINLWRYIDGDMVKNKELTTLKRNETCPCNQYKTAFSIKKNKKFKHCCGK